MRKIWNWLVVLLIMVALVGCRQEVVSDQSDPNGVGEESSRVEVSLEVDGQVYETEIEVGISVLELLELVSRENGVEVRMKEYSFGSLVEAIGEKENNDERTWIYYVDGVAGDVGAGEKILAGGERVEWRYEDVE